MIVIPSAAYYLPKFTYVWTLGVARFPGQLRKRVARDVALREIARSFLTCAGMTIPGEPRASPDCHDRTQDSATARS